MSFHSKIGIVVNHLHRGVEQLAARWAHNPKVGSSSLPSATKNNKDFENDSKSFFKVKRAHKTNTKVNKTRRKNMFLGQICKSPINYTGNKYRILPQFIKYFPQNVNKCMDLFTGGATVAINMTAKKIIAIDNNPRVINLLKFLKEEKYENLIKKIEKTIEEYELSNSYQYGYSHYKQYVEGNNGLKNYNQEGYKRLKQDYNNLKNKNTKKANLYLYILIIYGFNNDIRFNSKGEYNIPVGKTDMNKNNREKLKEYINTCREKQIEFICKDFREINPEEVEELDFIYADPPYLITDAVYNENDGWSKKEEIDLLQMLDKLHEKGIRFALSNVLQKRKLNIKNEILYDWLERNKDKYFINKIDYHYRSASYNKKNRDGLEEEILITNYKLEE